MLFKKLITNIKNYTTQIKNKSPTQHIGTQAELWACRYLQAQGLVFIDHQFHTKCGEIDLIMRDKEELVFVEVRYRQNTYFCDPIETLSHYKKQRLIHTALSFQQRYPWAHDLNARFDIVGISGDEQNMKINWIPNAFGVQ